MPYLGRTPTGTGSVTEIDGDLKVTGQLTAQDTLFKQILNGTDGSSSNAGDNLIIEDGGTDGSGTDAGDDICIEKDTGNKVDGENILGTLSSGIAAGDLTGQKGWEFVSRTTCSSASDVSYTNLTTGFDYQVVVTNLLFGTQNQLVTALVGVSGPTYRTSGYFSADYRIDSAGNSGGQKKTTSFNPMHTSATSSATGESYFIFTLFDPANASTETYANYDGITVNSELTYYRVTGGGKYGTAEANVALKFLPGSGNIATGFFDLYQRKNA